MTGHGSPNLGPGSEVWIPCTDTKQASFVPGIIVQTRGEAVSVYVEDEAVPCDAGRTYRVPVASLRPRFVRTGSANFPDNTSLVYMNDAAILENLQVRHQQDLIYTYTASVLLAVNPYKWSNSLYEHEQCEQYRGKHIGAMPPHPFAIAESAYRLLNRERKNQAILISGESGAGKTETAKIVMKYLAHVSGTGSDFAGRMQARVSRAQPILESLGNAATLRNNNSSRFGKYNRVFFDEAGTLADAAITTYLLESSRVVVHAERERSYHVFYEMLTGLTDEKLQEFGLVRNEPYRLLHSTGRPVSGFEDNDSRNFTRLVDAFKTVGLDGEKIDNTFQMLAGLVHLGDSSVDDENGIPVLAAEQDDEESPVVEINVEHVRNAAKLLGFDPDELAGTLRRKRIQIRGRKSLHEVARTPQQFRQALHSLIKALYKRLFEHMVAIINASFGELSQGRKDDSDLDMRTYIGILDIYGFERLEKNSFEQLCINLANERLQQYFVENVLDAEQGLYRREALPWTDLIIPDATPVVTCVAQVFATLDDYSSRLARGLEKDATDERFCRQVTDECNNDALRREILKRPQVTAKGRRTSQVPGANESFTIKHYAGQVDYTTRGWLDKNNDRLLAECEELIADSTNQLVRSLADEDKACSAQKSAFRSISRKYQQDLEALLQTLGTCNLHYIRCFKPNEEQKPNVFKQQLVLDQIVQCGTIELVKIMHDGYPNRCPFVEITQRFKGMLPESFQRYGDRTFIEAMMLAYKVPPGDWALGMSRLFLKAGQLKKLEDLRSDGTRPDPEDLARIVRNIIRKRWVRAGHAVRFSNYVPRLIAQVYVRRAAVDLSGVALLTGRFAPRLQAARQRVLAKRLAAKRRLCGCFLAVRFLLSEWRRIRCERRMRVEKALCLATFVIRRTRRWVTIGRQRAVEAQDRKEADKRRLEDERRRLEDQRRRLEEERKLEEARRREEEEARRIREAQRREEEERELQRRLEEEERRRREESASRAAQEEEWKRRQEMDFEMQRKKFEEEKQKFAQERREFEQLKAQEAAVQKTMSIMHSASPHGAKRSSFGSAEVVPAYFYNDDKEASTQITFTDEDITPMDSVSHVPQQQNEQEKEARELEMARKLHMMEEDFRKKQEEVMRQMLELQERNAQLERKLEVEGTRKQDPSENSERHGDSHIPEAATVSAPSPPPSRRCSLIPMSPEPSLAGGNASQPIADRRTSTSSRSGALRLSLVEPTFSGRRSSMGGSREPRNSSAQQALRQSMVGFNRSIGEAPSHVASTDNVYAQRKWWSEQREFLMQDLYPFGSPVYQGGMNGSAKRNSIVSNGGGGPCERLASGAAQGNPAAAAGGSAVGARVSTRNGEAPVPGPTARKLEDHFAAATGTDDEDELARGSKATKMKQPKVYSKGKDAPSFYWNKRNSMKADNGGSTPGNGWQA